MLLYHVLTTLYCKWRKFGLAWKGFRADILPLQDLVLPECSRFQ